MKIYNAVSFAAGVSSVILPGQITTNLSETETVALARVDWNVKKHVTGQPLFLVLERLDRSGTVQAIPECIRLVKSPSLAAKVVLGSDKIWHAPFDHGYYSIIGEGAGLGIPRLITELTDTMSRDLFTTLAANKGLISQEMYVDQQTAESGRTREYAKVLISTIRRAARRTADIQVGATVCLHRLPKFWAEEKIVNGGYFEDQILKDLAAGLNDAGADFVVIYGWVTDPTMPKVLLERANTFASLLGAA